MAQTDASLPHTNPLSAYPRHDGCLTELTRMCAATDLEGIDNGYHRQL